MSYGTEITLCGSTIDSCLTLGLKSVLNSYLFLIAGVKNVVEYFLIILHLCADLPTFATPSSISSQQSASSKGSFNYTVDIDAFFNSDIRSLLFRLFIAAVSRHLIVIRL